MWVMEQISWVLQSRTLHGWRGHMPTTTVCCHVPQMKRFHASVSIPSLGKASSSLLFLKPTLKHNYCKTEHLLILTQSSNSPITSRTDKQRLAWRWHVWKPRAFLQGLYIYTLHTQSASYTHTALWLKPGKPKTNQIWTEWISFLMWIKDTITEYHTVPYVCVCVNVKSNGAVRVTQHISHTR